MALQKLLRNGDFWLRPKWRGETSHAREGTWVQEEAGKGASWGGSQARLGTFLSGPQAHLEWGLGRWLPPRVGQGGSGTWVWGLLTRRALTVRSPDIGKMAVASPEKGSFLPRVTQQVSPEPGPPPCLPRRPDHEAEQGLSICQVLCAGRTWAPLPLGRDPQRLISRPHPADATPDAGTSEVWGPHERADPGLPPSALILLYVCNGKGPPKPRLPRPWLGPPPLRAGDSQGGPLALC